MRRFEPARRLWTGWRRWFNPLRSANAALRGALQRNAGHVRGRLLDVGCGGKPYADLFGQVDRYVGIDVLPSGGGQQDVYASGLQLPFAAGVFDTVLSTEVLEHVPEPSQLIGEAYRVLRPGGCLVLTTPQTWGLHQIPHDYYRYTPFGLRYLAEKNGFTVLRLEPTTGFGVTFCQRFCDVVFYAPDGRPNFTGLVGELVKVPLAMVQLLGAGFDKIIGQRGDTLDNLLIARRHEA